MQPENKKFLIACINAYTVSVTTHPGVIMYHMMMPDGRPLSICAENILMDNDSTTVFYSIYLGDDLLEEADVDTSDKTLNSIAKDIIELMRMCSTKIIMQEAHLMHSKFMIHEITNSKTVS